MTRRLTVLVCMLSFAWSSVSAAQSITDAGFLGSNGVSERAVYVRPALESELLPGHAAPWSPVPAQESIALTPDDALIVGIPHLQSSAIATIDTVNYSRHGNVIAVHATQEWFGGITATIYDDNDYLLPIGKLPAGEYRLDIQIDRIDRFNGTESVRSLFGFSSFRVASVPEPTSIMLMLFGIVGMASWARRCI